MLARILTDGGFRVLLAACARDALVLSESHEGSIEVLLSDIEMPGITGIELATRLQIQWPELKILLMSGRLRIGGAQQRVGIPSEAIHQQPVVR
jgi:DNA-binding NtrC family response regulator